MTHTTQPANVTELFRDLPVRQHMHVLVDDLSRALVEKNLPGATTALETLSRVVREAAAHAFPPSPTT